MNRRSWHLIQILLQLYPPIWSSGKVQPVLAVQFLHLFERDGPAVWMWFISLVVILEVWADAGITHAYQAVNAPVGIMMSIFGSKI